MTISSLLASGMQGMHAGINRTAIAAGRIAGSGVAGEHAANTVVELNRGAIDASIAANVIKTGDQILGTLIDIRG